MTAEFLGFPSVCGQDRDAKGRADGRSKTAAGPRRARGAPRMSHFRGENSCARYEVVPVSGTGLRGFESAIYRPPPNGGVVLRGHAGWIFRRVETEVSRAQPGRVPRNGCESRWSRSTQLRRDGW